MPESKLSRREAAAFMDTHEETISRWVKAGWLQCERVGKEMFFSKRELETLKEKRDAGIQRFTTALAAAQAKREPSALRGAIQLGNIFANVLMHRNDDVSAFIEAYPQAKKPMETLFAIAIDKLMQVGDEEITDANFNLKTMVAAFRVAKARHAAGEEPFPELNAKQNK
ncbi:MAG: helix-turn-helix domain-containing protein [Terriglobales bacterium]